MNKPIVFQITIYSKSIADLLDVAVHGQLVNGREFKKESLRAVIDDGKNLIEKLFHIATLIRNNFSADCEMLLSADRFVKTQFPNAIVTYQDQGISVDNLTNEQVQTCRGKFSMFVTNDKVDGYQVYDCDGNLLEDCLGTY